MRKELFHEQLLIDTDCKIAKKFTNNLNKSNNTPQHRNTNIASTLAASRNDVATTEKEAIPWFLAAPGDLQQILWCLTAKKWVSCVQPHALLTKQHRTEYFQQCALKRSFPAVCHIWVTSDNFPAWFSWNSPEFMCENSFSEVVVAFLHISCIWQT